MTVYLPIDGSQQGLLPASQTGGPGGSERDIER